MRKGVLVSMVGLGLLILMGCGPQVPEAPLARTAQQVEDQVCEGVDLWQTLANAGDVAGVAALFAEDAVYVDPYGRVYEGKEAVTGYLEEILSRYNEFRIGLSGVVSDGDLAAAHGTWAGTLRESPGAGELGGLWLTVYRYQSDGSLKAQLHQVMVPVPTPVPQT